VHFNVDFNRQKARIVTRSLGTRIVRFNRDMTLTKIIQKFTVRPGGAIAQSRPLNTPLETGHAER